MARTDYYNDPDAPPANSVVPSTTAVVTDDQDRIVLIRRRDNDLWALPGGGMELGESIVDTAVREFGRLDPRTLQMGLQSNDGEGYICSCGQRRRS